MNGLIILLLTISYFCMIISGMGKIQTTTLEQPCRPYDSCEKRCVKDPITHKQEINVTLGHLNCFCDQDCELFGDCCWDYKTECMPLLNDNVDQEIGSPKQIDSRLPDNSAYECVVVDTFSEGSYWMITKCADAWPDDVSRAKCTEKSTSNFVNTLPVLGDTGWTYRNAFCAQCNYVEDIYFWSIKAQCVRSAPEEVLSGDPETIAYYFKHFCTTEVMQDLLVDKRRPLKESLAWKRSLRSCEQSLITTCPDGFTNRALADACKRYQSIVIATSHTDENEKKLFKNPMCAMCHGYTASDLEHIVIQPKDKSDGQEAEPTMFCPVWIWTKYYDKAFWTLDSASTNAKLLPAFNNNYKTSSWSPPSFSVLMRFKEDGTVEIIYEDSSTTVVIPPMQTCNASQIYDPFSGDCRYVFCSNGLTYTEEGCVDKSHSNATTTMVPSYDGQESHTNSSGEKSGPIAGTVTVSIEVAVSDINRNYNSSQELGDNVVLLFENLLNGSMINVTINELDNSLNDTGDSVNLTMSFIIMQPGNYSEEEILELTEALYEVINFQEMIIEDDVFIISVVESRHAVLLECDVDSIKVMYNSSEYITTIYNGASIIYVNKSESYYMQGEYQLLDWSITVTEDTVIYSSMKESRVVVCDSLTQPPPPPTACRIYLPLNQSEYVILNNGSLWMDARGLMVGEDGYIDYGDAVAVCIDDYVPPEQPNTTSVATEPEMDPVVEIINWVTFGLTLFSLLSLCVTFITYVLFSELRTVAGRNLMNLTVALFVSQLMFMVGSSMIDQPSLCTAFTLILHYLFLSTFFWNNVMAFDVWLTFGQGIDRTFRRSVLNRPMIGGNNSFIRRTLIKYMVYGWGMPVLVVGICATVEFGFPFVRFGYSYDPKVPICWITNPTANLIAFGVPLSAILLCNSIFFILSIISIRKVTSKKYRKRYSESVPPLKKDTRLPSFTIPETLNETPSSPTFDIDDDVFTHETPKSPPANRTNTQNATHRRRHTSTGSMVAYKQSMGLARVNVLLYIKMSSVMGFTWALGFAAVVAETPVLWYIFEVSVPLQGVFILVSFVCKRRIVKLYREKFGRPSKQQGITGHNENTYKVKSRLRKIFFLPISRGGGQSCS